MIDGTVIYLIEVFENDLFCSKGRKSLLLIKSESMEENVILFIGIKLYNNASYMLVQEVEDTYSKIHN